MQRILDYGESEGNQFSKSVMKHANVILEARDLSPQIAEYIANIWEDEEIKKFFHDHLNVLQIPTSSFIFLIIHYVLPKKIINLPKMIYFVVNLKLLVLVKRNFQ